MARSDGSVIIDTRLNTAGFGKGVNSIKSQFTKMGAAASNVGGTITSVFTRGTKSAKGFNSQLNDVGAMAKKVGGLIAAAFSVGAVVNFAKEALELGSDLQEVQNVVDVTFTTMSDRVNEFAKNAASTAGLSETMAKRYTGTFGAMAKSFQFTEEEAFNMSTALTQLAGDVASFYNITQDEAYTKLKSVFTGETETLKDLGVVMTQTALDDYALRKGLGKTTSQMSEQEKVALRYQFVLDQLSAASGDFIRTQDGWANQTRILSLQFEQLKATIGQGLINALTPAIKTLNLLILELQKAAEAFKEFTETVFGSAGDTSGAIGGITDSTEDLGDAIEEAGKKAKKALAPFDEIVKISTESEETATEGSGVTITPPVIGGETSGEVTEETLAPGLQAAVDKILQLLEPLKNIDFSATSESVGDLKDALVELGEAVGEKLEEAWHNVLVPLAEWTIEEGVPATVDFLAEAISFISENLEEIIGYIPVIAAGFAGIKLGSFLADLLTANIRAETLKETIALLGKKTEVVVGVTLAITGATLEIKGISEAIQEGLNGINFAEILAGGSAFAGGGALIGNFFGSAVVGGAIAGVIAGVPAFIAGVYDEIVNGIDWLNAALVGVGATAAGASIGAIIGMLGGPITAGIGALIGLAVGLITDFTVWLWQSFEDVEAWFENLPGWAEVLIGVFFTLSGGIVPVITNIVTLIKKWDEISDWVDTNVVQPVSGFFSNLWSNVSAWASNAWEDIKEFFAPAARWFDENVTSPLGKFFTELWANIAVWAANAWADIQEFFAPAGEWLGELFENVEQTISDVFCNIGVIGAGTWEVLKITWDLAGDYFDQLFGSVEQTFDDIFHNIGVIAGVCWEGVKVAWQGAGKWFEDIWADIKKAFKPAADWFESTFAAAWQKVVAVFRIGGEIFKDIKEGVLSGLKTAVNWLIEGLNKVIAEPFNGINDALRTIRGIKIVGLQPFAGIKEISVPKIPYLAQGAVIPPNAPFMAVLGDQRHGTNIEAPLETIEQALENVLARRGSGMNDSQVIELLQAILEAILGIEIDGETLTNAMNNYQRKMAVSTGGNA